MTEVIDPRYVSEHNPEGIPRSCGVSCAWISTLYQPGGGTFASVLKDDGSIQVAADPEDEAPAQDPSWRASRDIWDHPAWRAWLKEHFVREDTFLCIRVDDVAKKKFSTTYSRKYREHNFYLKLPVQEFLTRDERTVVRIAACELFRYAAQRLGLPEPPPVLLAPSG